MINEKRTLEEFGYTSLELTKNSIKLVYRICDRCGREYITQYRAHNAITKGGCSKCYCTEELRIKKSQRMMGENNPMYNKHHSEKIKQKMSITRFGKNNNMYGKHHTEESRQKMSVATSGENNPMYGKCGKNHPNFGKRGLGISMYGKHHSEESKQKMSATSQGISIDDWEEYSALKYDCKFNTKLKMQIRASTNDCDFLTGEHKDICNSGEELSVHHIDYDKQNSNITNLIPLSRRNHSKTNTNRAFWTKLFTNMQHTRYLLNGVELDENN